MIWITGNSGAGKSTLAFRLKKDNSVILDGDELRRAWPELGFSEKDRWIQNFRAAKLGSMLERQGFNVIVATICPYKKLREELERDHSITWIKLRGGKEPSEEYPYESD